MAGGAELACGACGHDNVLGFGYKLMMRLVDCGVKHKTESIASGAKFPIHSGLADASFWGFCEVLKGCVFLMSFWIGEQVGPKFRKSATLTDKLIPMGWLGRGRRERRRAGEEKELGL